MSFNPSDGISERITGRKPFPRVAGMGKTDPEGVDAILVAELEEAGIEWLSVEYMRDSYEPHSSVIGHINAWGFHRAWYYWVCKGPGIPPEDAERLHAEHGTSVRVNGHCMCPSPLESCKGFAVGLYHVDNQEGLNALAAVIRDIYQRAERRKADSEVKAVAFLNAKALIESGQRVMKQRRKAEENSSTRKDGE